MGVCCGRDVDYTPVDNGIKPELKLLNKDERMVTKLEEEL